MRYISVLQRRWHVASTLARECFTVFRTQGSLQAMRFTQNVIEGVLDERFGPPRPPKTNRLDKEFGTDTAENVKLHDLDIQSPNAKYAVYYKATDLPLLDEILSALATQFPAFNSQPRTALSPVPITVLKPSVPDTEPVSRPTSRQARGPNRKDPGFTNISNSTFIDFGSGKGLVLLRAAGCPFKKVIGVEFARELHEIARKNVDGYPNYLRRTPIELVHGDALEFPFPEGNLVLYFYQPFEAPLTAQMISRIQAAADGRQILVACVFSDSPRNPFRTLWETAPFLQPVAQGKLWTIYRACTQ